MRSMRLGGWCALFLLLGCGRPMGGVGVHLKAQDFASPSYSRRVVEVAFQDGSWPWERLALTGGEATFEIADPDGRYCLATVMGVTWTGQPEETETEIHCTTVSEARSFDWGPWTSVVQPDPAPAPVPNLTLRNLDANEYVSVSFGTSGTSGFPTNGVATVAVQDGLADLFVTRSSPTERTRVLVQRKRAISTASPVTLDLSDAVAPLDVITQVTGVAPNATLCTRSELAPTDNGSPLAGVQLGAWCGDPRAAAFQVLPTELTSSGDSEVASLAAVSKRSRQMVVGHLRILAAEGVELPMPPSTAVKLEADHSLLVRWDESVGGGVSVNAYDASAHQRLYLSAPVPWLRDRSEFTLSAMKGAPALDANLDAVARKVPWVVGFEAVRRGATCARSGVECSVYTIVDVDLP